MVNVKINNLSMKYEKKLIIENFELEILDGELLVLLGASGCGKTSLLKIIAGIIDPEEGTVIFDKEDITKYTPQKRKVGYVPQAQVLFPHMKVEQNISFGLEAHKLSKEEIKERIKWIAEITQIQDLLNRFPSEISGGQKQRVALARALAIKPSLLLLDEPLSSIDASGRESLALTIRRIQKETGITTLYVTHNQEESRLISDRVALMYDGKIQQIGSVIEVDRTPRNYLIAKIMGSSNVWPVEFLETKNGNSLVSTPVGLITLPYEIKRKITGIKIPPSSFKIVHDLSEDDKMIEFIGRIKSIIEKDDENFRIVVDLKDAHLEYFKVDCKKEMLNIGSAANKELQLHVLPSEVILI